MGAKIKHDSDLSNEEQIAFKIAKEIGQQFAYQLHCIAAEQLNLAMKKTNGFDQTTVQSYFAKIHTMVFMSGVINMKEVADQIGDNEMTVSTLFEEMIEGMRFTLGLPKPTLKKEEKEYKNGIKKISKI